MRTGLTLGKYAPLHRGHQYVIEQALAQTDHVIVIIYDVPATTSVPLPVRAGWIRQIYPQVEVIEAWDGPTKVSNEPAIQRQHEAYLRQLLGERQITHFYSSEFYGDHVSRSLGARDCRVDEARQAVPVTGTAIRRDSYTHRHVLAPLVSRDRITTVVLRGAPSTGKTTLAAALAQHHGTVCMPEYGREYWDQHQVNRRLSLEQLVEIAEGHRLREDALTLDANRWLFVDTDATTTAMFSRYYHGAVHPRLAALAEQAATRYDLCFLCSDDIPYDATWDRSGEANRRVFQRQIIADLVTRRIPFITLSGTLAQRLATVNEVLRDFDKYASLGDHLRRRGTRIS